MPIPRFSLIIATVERTDTLSRLLASLSSQTFQDFEVILVDQNEDDRLDSVIGAWSSNIKFVHLRSARGLSRARNVGLREACGEIVAFPDDDCWYAPDMLQRVHQWFLVHPEFSFYSTSAVDEKLRPAANRWLRHPCEITRNNIFRAAISFSLFFRSKAICAAGGFDERLGLGAGTRYGSGEETDYVLRVMKAGFRGWFDSELTVFHPSRTRDSSHGAQASAYRYGVGFGYVLRSHRFPMWYSIYLCARPVAGWIAAQLNDRSIAPIYSATFSGRLNGYFRQGDL